MGDVQGLEETREAPAALLGSLWGRREVRCSGVERSPVGSGWVWGEWGALGLS